MEQKLLLCLLLTLLCLIRNGYGQETDQPTTGVLHFPAKFLGRLDRKMSSLQEQLIKQTEKYLEKERRREEKLHKKFLRYDTNAAKSIFYGAADKYSALAIRMKNDTGSPTQKIGGEYQAYTDSIKGALSFLYTNPQLNGKVSQQAGQAASQLQSLQAKLGGADQIRDLVKQRRQQINDYISQHSNIAGILGKEYQAMNQELYYYSQRLREYKQMLNDPDKLEMEALSALRKVPAFTTFMKEHSQLAVLFNLAPDYGSAEGLAGLQTKDQVAALIGQRVGSPEGAGPGVLQSRIGEGQGQMGAYQDKLNQLGTGSGDIDMPDFKPNDQKTKRFLNRLEYGTNFQTTHGTYYFPTTSDFGLSVAYKLDKSNSVGLGASYKLGWGNGIQHIAFSSQGIGLRSFLEIKIKGSFFSTGGFEYNYATPFQSLQQLRRWDDWSKSGLIGVSKVISVKSRVFKKTKLQFLWDFLSYQQVPRTQPIIFRIGYTF